MLADYQNSFTGGLGGKFSTNSYLNITAHFTYVATDTEPRATRCGGIFKYAFVANLPRV